MEKKCLNCGKNFEAKRETAKFCSSKCRKLAFQSLSVPKVSVPVSVPKPKNSVPKVSVPKPELSVTKNSVTNKVSVTKVSVPNRDNTGQPIRDNTGQVSVTKPDQSEHPNKLIANNGLEVREGYCHACGKKVANLICICYECIKKGHTHESLGIPMCETK